MNEVEYNERLAKIQIDALTTALEFETLTTEERIKLQDKLFRVKQQTANADAQTTKERISQLSDVGKTLMDVGRAQGENSKITQAGIKITAAATLAETGHAMVKQFKGLSEDVSKGFPTNIIAVASTLALIASFASSFKAFTGGGGGSSEVETQGTFAKGGLTNGGMFEGASHANGGVKFAVGGRIMEAEGGEAIINKRSTARFRPILSAINSYNGNGVKFADGGLINSGEKFAMGGELRSIQQMVSGGGSSKVVMVESDVTKTQGRVSSLEAQASF